MQHPPHLTALIFLTITATLIQTACAAGPAITITSPQVALYKTNAIWANVTLDVDGSWCEYSLNSKPNIFMGGGPVNWSTLLNIEDGVHNITYFCSDTSNNINQSNYHYMMIDTTPPQVSIEITPNPVESFKNIRLQINCSDEVSGCNTVDIKIPFADCLTKISEGTLYEITTPYCTAQTYEYRVHATDHMDNTNSSVEGTITIRKSDGCDCSSNTECMNTPCVLGICMKAKDPSLKFYLSNPETIETGNYWTLILWLKNNMDTEDTIRLELTGIPEKIEYWSSFENNKKSIDIRLGPQEEKFTIIKTFAGKVGTYRLHVVGKSLSIPTYSNHTSKQINIVEKKDPELFSKTPGLNTVSYIIAILMSLLVMQKIKSI